MRHPLLQLLRLLQIFLDALPGYRVAHLRAHKTPQRQDADDQNHEDYNNIADINTEPEGEVRIGNVEGDKKIV